MKSGIELISIERQEQIEKHGRTVEHDVSVNGKYQLVRAAEKLLDQPGSLIPGTTPPHNWHLKTWCKIAFKPYKERLIIAGAFIAAELDRLQALETELKQGK